MNLQNLQKTIVDFITGSMNSTSVLRGTENQKPTIQDARSGNDKINIHTSL